MANVEKFKIGNMDYPVRDANTLRSLSTAQEETLLADGTYNGEEVEDGEVFTSVDGAFKEFKKGRQTDTESDEYTGGIWGGMGCFNEYLFSTGLNGDGFTVLVSQDGKNWSAGTNEGFSTSDSYMKAFTSSNKAMLVRIADNTNSLAVFKTTTGNVWVSDTITIPKYAYGCDSISFGDVWLLVKTSSSDNDTYIYSNDGVTWTEKSYPATISGDRYMFVVGSKLMLLDSSGHVFESTNAIDWTYKGTTSLPTTGFGAGNYYFYTSGYNLYKSTDCINGTLIGTIPITDKTYTRGTYANGVYVIYGENEVSVSYDDATTFEPEYRYTLSGGGNLYALATSSFIYVCSWVWSFQGTAYYCIIPTGPSYSLTNITNASLDSIADAGDGIKFDTEKEENFTVEGSPTIVDDVASNFGDNQWVNPTYTFNPNGKSFEVGGSIITTDPNAQQYFFGCNNWQDKTILLGIYQGEFDVNYSSDGSNWGTKTGETGTLEIVSANVKYYFKFAFDGISTYTFSTSTDKENWATSSWTGSPMMSSGILHIGACWDANYGSVLRGSADLKDYYIKVDGSLVWQAVVISTIPSITLDIATDQANAPTSSDEGYIGKLWVTSGGAVYICTGVSGSTYTWAQITTS